MRSATFFVIRSPLLNADSRTTGRRSPEEQLEDPIIREALRRASPSVCAALEGTGSRREQAWPSVVRYFERMRGRCTPFSLMAGYSLGQTRGTSADIRLVPRHAYRRAVRLDLDTVVRVLSKEALSDPTSVRWTTRAGLVLFPDIVRVARRSQGGEAITHADVVRTEALDAALLAAQGSATLEAIVDAISRFADDRASAEGFVAALVEQGLIVPESLPSILVDDELLPLEASPRGRHLSQAARAIRESTVGEPVDLGSVEGAGAAGEGDLIFDLVKPVLSATLGDDVVAASIEVLRVLQRVTHPTRDPRLDEFQTRFLERFEMREVPLLEAVDARRGLGFPHERPQPESEEGRELREWKLRLFERACRQGRDASVEEPDLPDKRWDPPDSFALLFSLAESPVSIWKPIISPAPGTESFARATSVVPGLRQLTSDFLREVARREPDVDFVDLAYFVPGRSAAFMQYPPVYPKAIALSTPGGRTAGSLVDPNDLLLSVRDGLLRLRSVSTGREVRVRATSAANPDRQDTTDVFRLLEAMSKRHPMGDTWTWGSLQGAGHLPRVTYKDHVLHPAMWNFARSRVHQLREVKTRQARWDAAQRLRADLDLPRHIVAHGFGDHRLPVDLDDPWSVEGWLDVAQNHATVSEAFPHHRSAVRGPEGPYDHEIVLPMIGEPTRSGKEGSTFAWVTDDSFDRVMPGGPVLYLSMYGDLDELIPTLIDVVGAVVRPLAASGVLTHWFFLPYSDPDAHVRLRLFGKPGELWHPEVLGAFRNHLEPLLLRRVLHRVTVGTYDRETYRYGGPRGIDLAERAFHVSSEIATDLHSAMTFDVSPEEADDAMVSLVRSLRALVGATELSTSEQRDIAKFAVTRAANDGEVAAARKWAAELYRRLRPRLLGTPSPDEEFGPARMESLRGLHRAARSEVSPTARYRAWLVDCLHVHSIRLLTPWRQISHQEVTGYQLLQKVLGAEESAPHEGSRAPR